MSLRDSLPSFLNHPYYVLLVTLVSLISLPLSIFFFFESREFRDLVFTVDPARTIIARAGRPSELKVDFKGETIKTDVVGVQVALWNQGKKSIHASDVLTPLEIRLNPATPILQVSVAKASRGVIALALTNDADILRQGRVPVGFRILEQDDGGIVQIIYAGPSDVEVALIGVVEGAGAPRNLRATVRSSTEQEQPPGAGARLFARLFPWGFLVFLLAISIPGMVKRLRRQGPRSTVDIVLLVADFGMLFAGLAMVYIIFSRVPYMPTPPFGWHATP